MQLRTRQFVCRGLFLVVGLVPLLCSVAYAAWQSVALGTHSYERVIAAEWGLDLRVQSVTHPTPRRVRFAGADLADPASGVPIAKCDFVDVHREKDEDRVQLNQVTVRREHFQRVLQLLYEQAAGRQRRLENAAFVDIEQIDVVDADGSQDQLTEFRLDTKQGLNGPLAKATFLWNGGEVWLELTRDQSQSPPQTIVRLHAQDTPLPCHLFLDPLLSTMLGEDAQFQGVMKLGPTNKNWSLTGALTNVDLAASNQGSLLTGNAVIESLDAQFGADGQMQRLSGKLRASGGQVNQAWLAELAARLGWKIRPLAPTDGQAVTEYGEYRELGIRFVIDENQAAFHGIAGGIANHLLIDKTGQPIAVSRNQPATTTDLLRAFLRLSDEQVPVALPGQSLLRFLPWP